MKPIKKMTIYLAENTSIENFTEVISNKFATYVDTDSENPILFIEAKKTLALNLLKTKEEKILQHLRDGSTYNETAEKMGISVNGVRFYVKKIYKKLDVNNVRAAISKYYA